MMLLCLETVKPVDEGGSMLKRERAEEEEGEGRKGDRALEPRSIICVYVGAGECVNN